MSSMPITELEHLSVLVATWTVGDIIERRVELVDTRDGAVLVSLTGPSALEVGRKVTARAKLLMK